ncbi:DoxX family protein [Candidatus Woesearchaeota archaeon]|nr:MAG: DoxX family protein [Candidatus Woesearchaeota archaeon]
MDWKRIGTWALQIVPAVLLFMAAPGKFTGAAQPVFEQLGVFPWGMYLTGVLEVIAAVLLLIPVTAVWGGVIAAVVMLGALASHVFVLGINVGMMTNAFIILVTSIGVIVLRRN